MVVCHTAVYVSLVSKRGKSLLWIEPLRGKNPYNGVGFAFASEQGAHPVKELRSRASEGGIPTTESDL